ncbi:hypothetical protein [Reichenbachiella sp.]|uniref:hypothetical protein n=1 Tax=Reichenbachiella sp. TaxID=2184521 RepID=UPI003BB211BC
MKKLTFLFALALSISAQAQNIENGAKMNFKNSAGALDGTTLYRNSGSHMRFEFFNHFDFKSLNGGYIKIRNANKISIKLNPNGDSYFDDGNIGLGTKSPEELLHLKRNNATIKLSSGQYHQSEGTVISRIKFNNHNTGNTSLDYSSEIRGLLTGSSAQLVGMQFLTLGSVRMHIDDGGNVGIGTEEPVEKLQINGGALQFYNIGNNSNNVDIIKINEGSSVADSNEFTMTGMFEGTSGNNAIKFRSKWTNNILFLKADGNVGIGTSTPSAMLSVAGKMDAQEIKVEVDAGVVPDYVFASDYNLTTLEETANYIEENHHLPEIPSATEMEAYGMNVGEMNLLLLKKIEELTLHLINQNERLESQQKEIELLKQR